MPAILAFLRQIFGTLALSKVFTWIKGTAKTAQTSRRTTAGTGKGILGTLYGMFEKMLNTTGMMVVVVEGLKKLIGFVGIGGAVVSGGASVGQIWNLFNSIADPQKALLDYLSDALGSVESFSTLLTNIDNSVAGITGQAFTPAVTFTSMLQMTGVGEAFNQIMMSTIQGLTFIFSVFVVRWAFTNNFTFTKSVNKQAKR